MGWAYRGGLAVLPELVRRGSAALASEPYANLFLSDLTHDVPACYIAAAEFDPLRDDSATLAAICEQYGTPFRFELFEGVIHAFLHYTKMLDAAQRRAGARRRLLPRDPGPRLTSGNAGAPVRAPLQSTP